MTILVAAVFLSFLSSVCVCQQFASPTSASLAECSALKAAIPNGDKCTISNDCARLQCSTSLLGPLYPIQYNVTIHKCHHPVRVSFDVLSSDFRWSHTFKGNRTEAIANVPPAISGTVGKPYAHVEVSRFVSGIVLSAALWFKQNGQWTKLKVPIVEQQKIPLDTSDCPSSGYNFVTPGVYNPSGGLPGQKNVMDLLKKFGFFKFLDKFQKGRGSANVGDDKDSSYLVSDIPMWASDYPEIDPYDDSVVQMCISQLLEKEGVDYWTTEGPAFTDDLENCYCNKMKFSGHVSCQSSIGGNKDSSDTKGYIIGGCVGGAVVLAIVVAIILFAIYMKKRTPTVAGVSYKELEEE
ncbi:uncharacterized protein LOC134186715 [Corticium candelabrum]|uniref:uncharacterized protein LOC134186715 n=1 Tax=Corticium candelabrum TaxID=121492 RepID=UPI002E26FADF|nr:uncharacterized protein LOC134186715 [Corticium candelabrum]